MTKYTVPMSEDDKPKTAVELAMERLRKKDTDSGVVEHPPTDEQKSAIAEARSVHAAKLAELEILYRSKVIAIFEPEALAQAQAQHRRDLQRLSEDLERKIGKIRPRAD